MRAWLTGWSVVLVLVAGCSTKPCATSTECGTGEVCANERCQALSCDRTFAAIDPADGTCKPIGACAGGETVRSWTSCADPCVGLAEFACVKDVRCQPVYVGTASTSDALVPCPADPLAGACPGGGTTNKTFSACRANPIDVTPCAKLDATDCKSNPRCTIETYTTGGGCDCAADSPCNCGGDVPAVSECRERTCTDYSPFECLSHPECATSQAPSPGPCHCAPDSDCACAADAAGAGSGTWAVSCYPRYFGCSGMDETTCLAHPECHAVGSSCYCPPGAECDCSGGGFLYCESDDGLARCNADSDCAGDQRCNNDEQCAPPNGSGSGFVNGQPGVAGSTTTGSGSTGIKSLPADPIAGCAGLCVPRGCTGYGEAKCNADPSCEAVYLLQCSPYGGGPELDAICGGDTGPNAGAPIGCGGSGCEPAFVQCLDGKPVNGVAPQRAVLIREPSVVDDPSFDFATVMAALAGGQDVNAFVTRWLQQITTDQTANGRSAKLRMGARDYLAGLPHLANGYLDAKQLGFQTTSLSNRIDLAGPHDCGEARITFALKAGVTDRRHRMTVIVELRQPDDGAGCRTVANQWLALSSLSGAALTDALKLIYVPLLAPVTLNQVRTNEFLVGPQVSVDPAQNEPWELREWRLGTDGALHLAASKQAVDPNVVYDASFQSWVAANESAVLRGAVTVPDAYLAVTSSEDGSRIFVPTDQTGLVSTAIDKMSCAGCHTTQFNTAFAHVAERFHGTGQATISKFLEEQLSSRAMHVWSVAHGGLTATFRNAPHPVH